MQQRVGPHVRLRDVNGRPADRRGLRDARRDRRVARGTVTARRRAAAGLGFLLLERVGRLPYLGSVNSVGMNLLR